MNEALKIAQCEEFVARKGGLDAVVERAGKNFSGGQRQRLTIARAIVENRDILILDDSFSALDFATEKKLRVALNKLPATKIIVSERLTAIADADEVLLLSDGKTDAIGKYDELMDKSALFCDIVRSQNIEEEGKL